VNNKEKIKKIMIKIIPTGLNATIIPDTKPKNNKQNLFCR
jgi:hypothetical protein